MKIAIQGEAGSFSEEAALQLHPDAEPVSCASFVEVFERFHSRRVERALVPIENTLAGSIGENLDLLRRTPGFIVAETELRIRHQLIVHPDAKLTGIRRVLSHPVALAQCRRFLSRHREWEAVPFYDTAGSVKHVMETGDHSAAAIAGERAAAVYRARIARRGIEDNKQNFTRFLLLAPSPEAARLHNKVSVVFTLANRPGALFKGLRPMADEGISLTRIESRPVLGRPWEYSFFVDLLADPTQAAARRGLRELEKNSLEFRLLGAYAAHRNSRKTKNLKPSGSQGQNVSLSLSDFMRIIGSINKDGAKTKSR